MPLGTLTADEGGVEALRGWFFRHNRQVLLLATATLAVSIASWAATYFGLYWLVLLFQTAAGRADAAIPAGFLVGFLAGAAVLCTWVWLERRRWPDGPTRDHQSPLTITADILLAVPRITVTAWETLSALQFLSDDDLAGAWRLLGRLREKPALPVQSVPLDLPERAGRERILVALQVAGLIEFQRRSDALFLTLRSGEARTLSQGKIRLRARR